MNMIVGITPLNKLILTEIELLQFINIPNLTT